MEQTFGPHLPCRFDRLREFVGLVPGHEGVAVETPGVGGLEHRRQHVLHDPVRLGQRPPSRLLVGHGATPVEELRTVGDLGRQVETPCNISAYGQPVRQQRLRIRHSVQLAVEHTSLPGIARDRCQVGEVEHTVATEVVGQIGKLGFQQRRKVRRGRLQLDEVGQVTAGDQGLHLGNVLGPRGDDHLQLATETLVQTLPVPVAGCTGRHRSNGLGRRADRLPCQRRARGGAEAGCRIGEEGLGDFRIPGIEVGLDVRVGPVGRDHGTVGVLALGRTGARSAGPGRVRGAPSQQRRPGHAS